MQHHECNKQLFIPKVFILSKNHILQHHECNKQLFIPNVFNLSKNQGVTNLPP
jgi:hypothetical protein